MMDTCDHGDGHDGQSSVSVNDVGIGVDVGCYVGFGVGVVIVV